MFLGLKEVKQSDIGYYRDTLNRAKLGIAVIAQAAMDLYNKNKKERLDSVEFFLTSGFRFYLGLIEEAGLPLNKIIGVGKTECWELARGVLKDDRAVTEKYRYKVLSSPAVMYLQTGKLPSTETKFVKVGDLFIKEKQLKKPVKTGEVLQPCLVC